jgi:broad specificity phosphatase PhoE
MTQLILVRHGQTTWNKVERVRGQVEIPLDEVGLAQAEATGRRIAAEWHPAAVYCSPLIRAVQTAQAIARCCRLDVQPTDGLNDLNFGQWQGLSPAEIQSRWPAMAKSWLSVPHTVTFPGGESLAILRDRAMSAVQHIIQVRGQQDVVLVAHTVVNRVILLAMLGLDNSHYWRIGQDTCAVNAIRWDSGAFYIESLNDTCHLHDQTR